jgi:BirA family transcriptional regulator, biotin operon repressor / biotin---[acetyl-CoA-carboxylase] ligase
LSGSPYTDLSRPPLREAALTRALVRPEGLWRRLRVVAETGSTNADATLAVRAGEAEGLVIIAETQTAGRGRLDRRWQAPPRSSIIFSAVVRPIPPPATWGWLPLLAGVALAEAVGRLAVVDAVLKWPNDLLVRSATDGDAAYGKAAGVLAEIVDSNVVVGVGLNVSQRDEELPAPPAGAPPPTSLALVGAATTDRDPLLRAVLRAFEAWYERWSDAGGAAGECGLLPAYRELCVTLGTDVAVSLPGGGTVHGRARDVDADGHLLVDTRSGVQVINAGDVHHVRRADAPDV